MLRLFMDHCFEITAVILFGIGIFGLLFHPNLIKKIISFNIMDCAIYLFLASRGYVFGRTAPILGDNLSPEVTEYINPIPAGLVLTGIVVSVSVTAFFLALVQRLYEKYHTLNLDEINRIAHYERLIKQERKQEALDKKVEAKEER